MNEVSQLETFDWHGQTRYRCPSCDFDGPTEVHVLKHWMGSHAEPPVLTGPTLFDAEGKTLPPTQERDLYVPEALRSISTRTARRHYDSEEL